MVSNPADVTTAAVYKESGLPSGRVIGSGTSLDTARFRYILSEKLHVNVEDINAYILGEHGDSQVPIFSSANIGGFPLYDYAQQVGITLDEEEIAHRTKGRRCRGDQAEGELPSMELPMAGFPIL